MVRHRHDVVRQQSCDRLGRRRARRHAGASARARHAGRGRRPQPRRGVAPRISRHRRGPRRPSRRDLVLSELDARRRSAPRRARAPRRQRGGILEYLYRRRCGPCRARRHRRAARPFAASRAPAQDVLQRAGSARGQRRRDQFPRRALRARGGVRRIDARQPARRREQSALGRARRGARPIGSSSRSIVTNSAPPVGSRPRAMSAWRSRRNSPSISPMP